jgi:hypothetical protein
MPPPSIRLELLSVTTRFSRPIGIARFFDFRIGPFGRGSALVVFGGPWCSAPTLAASLMCTPATGSQAASNPGRLQGDNPATLRAVDTGPPYPSCALPLRPTARGGAAIFSPILPPARLVQPCIEGNLIEGYNTIMGPRPPALAINSSPSMISSLGLTTGATALRRDQSMCTPILDDRNGLHRAGTPSPKLVETFVAETFHQQSRLVGAGIDWDASHRLAPPPQPQPPSARAALRARPFPHGYRPTMGRQSDTPDPNNDTQAPQPSPSKSLGPPGAFVRPLAARHGERLLRMDDNSSTNNPRLRPLLSLQLVCALNHSCVASDVTPCRVKLSLLTRPRLCHRSTQGQPLSSLRFDARNVCPSADASGRGPRVLPSPMTCELPSTSRWSSYSAASIPRCSLSLMDSMSMVMDDGGVPPSSAGANGLTGPVEPVERVDSEASLATASNREGTRGSEIMHDTPDELLLATPTAATRADGQHVALQMENAEDDIASTVVPSEAHMLGILDELPLATPTSDTLADGQEVDVDMENAEASTVLSKPDRCQRSQNCSRGYKHGGKAGKCNQKLVAVDSEDAEPITVSKSQASRSKADGSSHQASSMSAVPQRTTRTTQKMDMEQGLSTIRLRSGIKPSHDNGRYGRTRRTAPSEPATQAQNSRETRRRSAASSDLTDQATNDDDERQVSHTSLDQDASLGVQGRILTAELQSSNAESCTLEASATTHPMYLSHGQCEKHPLCRRGFKHRGSGGLCSLLKPGERSESAPLAESESPNEKSELARPTATLAPKVQRVECVETSPPSSRDVPSLSEATEQAETGAGDKVHASSSQSGAHVHECIQNVPKTYEPWLDTSPLQRSDAADSALNWTADIQDAHLHKPEGEASRTSSDKTSRDSALAAVDSDAPVDELEVHDLLSLIIESGVTSLEECHVAPLSLPTSEEHVSSKACDSSDAVANSEECHMAPPSPPTSEEHVSSKACDSSTDAGPVSNDTEANGTSVQLEADKNEAAAATPTW